MNKTPDVKISIITVCKNSVGTIEQMLCSGINQSYKNVEYIVIDGQSDDGTVDRIKKYEAGISYWGSELDGGTRWVRNRWVAEMT